MQSGFFQPRNITGGAYISLGGKGVLAAQGKGKSSKGGKGKSKSKSWEALSSLPWVCLVGIEHDNLPSGYILYGYIWLHMVTYGYICNQLYIPTYNWNCT